MSYRRHTPINHEKRTPLEGVLSVSQDRISRQVREPFFPTQPKRTMGRGLARGGERLRCHRPLSLSRFPIRVSTINKFVLHSQFPRPDPFYFIYLFCCRTHNPREGVVLVVLAIMVCSPFACVFLLLLLLLFHCGGSPRVNASVCR